MSCLCRRRGEEEQTIEQKCKGRADNQNGVVLSSALCSGGALWFKTLLFITVKYSAKHTKSSVIW